MNKSPIIVEQIFQSSKEVIWEALTLPEQMKQWFFHQIPNFNAEVGFEVLFDVHANERVFPHLWKVLEVVPNKKLVIDWRYKGYKGAGKVTFELIDQPTGNLVRLTAEGMESFPQDIPEFKRESGLAGWKYFIQGELKKFLI